MQTGKPKKPSSSGQHNPKNPPPKTQSMPKIDTHASSSTSHSPENPAPLSPPAPGITFDSRTDHSLVCRWTVPDFSQLKAKSLYSPYFQVGGYDFRFFMYPRGDSLAVHGHISLYLQINCPKSSKLDCFASYKLAVVNATNESKSVSRESYYRFSTKRKSIGWSEFAVVSSVLDTGSGFLLDDSLLIKADIRILNECVTISGCTSEAQPTMPRLSGPSSHVSSGKITWKVKNYMLFKDMVKTQKLVSPGFQVGEINLRICVHHSVINGVDYLAVSLETKDTDKFFIVDRSSWCLFRISVLNQKPGLNHIHKDSYGRFGMEHFGGDVNLGWTDYMKISDFVARDKGFLVDDTAVFSVSFNAIKECSISYKTGGLLRGKCAGMLKNCDGYVGKFMWTIENFSKLKDLLKKKKKVGLCVKSKRFQVGNQDFRLLVYPRGQSEKPCYLSMFLNVLDSRKSSSSWSCFVCYRLSVINQGTRDKSIVMESQNRCSKATTDWGWCEFISLTSLFDQDSGYLFQDTVVFSAEICVLKETFSMHNLSELSNGPSHIHSSGRPSFTWKLENFLSLKEVVATRNLFSKFFQFGGCELRIGICERFGTIFTYLECDPSAASDPDKNFWVSYRMGLVNQKNPAKSLWKESSICTRSCNNSDLELMKVADMLEVDAGFLVREMVVLVCEIIDYCPWLEFSGLEFLNSDNDLHGLSNDRNELSDCGDSEVSVIDSIDIFSDLLSTLIDDDNPLWRLGILKEVRMDIGAVANILIGLRFYLDDPIEMRRFQTEFSNNKRQDSFRLCNSSSSLVNLEMLNNVLKQAINDVILDILVECCQPSKGRSCEDTYDASSKPYPDPREISPAHSVHSLIFEKLFSGVNNRAATNSGQCSNVNVIDIHQKQHICPPEASAGNPPKCRLHSFKTTWPEPSVELLGLIVNSLKALNGTVSPDCLEPRKRPQLSDKIFLLLDKAPKSLLPDIVSLVVKLVDRSEHPLVVFMLLDQLQKPEVESALQTSVFAGIGQLELSSEVWKQVLSEVCVLFSDSDEELLGATVTLLFKAASQCQQIPEAVRFVRTRLESLGGNVSSCVLDILSRTINGSSGAAETMLGQINSVFQIGEKCLTDCFEPLCDENGLGVSNFYSVDEQLPCADCHFLNIYILIEMLSIPSLSVEASQTFERGVALGLIKDHTVVKVLEKRCVQKLNINLIQLTENDQRSNITERGSMESCLQDVEFSSVLDLAKTLSLSKNPQVHGFVRLFYTILIRLFADEKYHRQMLKGLVERATNPAVNAYDSDLDILAFLIQGEYGIARLFVSMMREIAEVATADRETLWHRLRASEDENVRIKEEGKAELSNIKKEKASLLERLSEFKADVTRLESEVRLGVEHFEGEKKEFSKQIDKVKSQLEHHCCERDAEIAKFSIEKKVYQDRINDLEKELLQLKSQKHDELKKVGKEKNMLSHKLRRVQTEREHFEAELKHSTIEAASYRVAKQSLLDEVCQLKQRVTQTEGEKQEMEEEMALCKAHIIEMERKLIYCKQHISSLEVSLQEEMLQHAPLYGVGLEDLSTNELETVLHIHEEGLKEIRTLQHRLSRPFGNHLSSANTSQFVKQVGLAVPCNDIKINGNRHNNNPAGPRFVSINQLSSPLGDPLLSANTSRHIEQVGHNNTAGPLSSPCGNYLLTPNTCQHIEQVGFTVPGNGIELHNNIENSSGGPGPWFDKVH